MAHITGGGLHENLSRLTPNYTMCINKDSWDMPTIFSTLQKLGNISSDEMLNVFNCGIGYCIVLDRENADKAMSENTELFEIGYVDTKSDQSLIFV
jgi:phosphoribosylformylglycinamidine cyclo-ligase